ncbi:helix-turn-helix domain-containing protein [Rhodococcus sp. 14-1411-2a]|uniref:helix-turn-helix domain-containing protein n=1 Tax=Rhodococcus sp. 14-1411-2a TaxID=2023151 RepID=UPI0015C5D45E|nr:helix-turn-helix domain-containing protein [Rhodococcus sp. 14-1411-2a]
MRTISKTVATGRPLPEVLDLIARTAASLMGYEFCGVLLPDHARRTLTIEGSSGLSADYIAQVNADRPVRLDQPPTVEAPSSTAFRTGIPTAIADIDAEPQFAPWGGVAKEQGYRSMISVPLMESPDISIGTLNCYRRSTHNFAEQEIALLTVLADHAAIALTTSRLRSEEATRMSELVILNEELHQQRDLLQKSEDIHRKLTEIALRGGGVAGIATALSILISRAILIEDTHGGVLGQSSRTAVFPDDRTSAPAGTDASSSEFRCHPVLLAGSEVARMWIAPGLSALSSIEERAVEHAALVTSLEVLRSRTADEVQWRLHGDLVSDLLGGEPGAVNTVIERAGRLGHDLTLPHSLVVLALSGVQPGHVDASLQQAIRRIHLWAENAAPRPLSAIHHDRIVVLVPHVGQSPTALYDAAEKIRGLSASRSPHAVATAITVGPCTDLNGYIRLHRSAVGALGMLALTGRIDTTVSLDELGLVGLLLQLDDTSQLLSFADRILGPVRSHDTARGTDLLKTLRTYFACGLANRDTARSLHVHVNTVGQRLRRIQMLTGMDLARPDHAMEIAVALTVGDVGEASRPA